MTPLSVVSSEFTIRAGIEPFGSALVEPEVVRAVIDALLKASRGLGLANQQIRNVRSAVVAETTVEGYFPERQVLVKISPMNVQIHAASAVDRNWFMSTLVFYELAKTLSGVLGLASGATTTWAAHVREDLIPSIPAETLSALVVGPALSHGLVANSGPPQWEPSALACSVALEPSALVERGTFISLTVAWGASDSPLPSRVENFCRNWQSHTGFRLWEQFQ